MSRIESRHRLKTESRTEPWLESSVELKLEPRACSESEQGTVPRYSIATQEVDKARLTSLGSECPWAEMTTYLR
ncbi:hypothetical protein EVAR_93426_1 [Eumeta japonica]|uniref:Uncharacterized protein n=1 Tax=Eumeta variegata TaxID=151549 RepID=A0A4C1UQ77_EUMVA|nr:hypothetical protein EVAR_93426_1 [Eumeta japonica]